MCCTAACAFVCSPLQPARAQSLDPRAFANVPVGANFLSASLSRSSGDVALDPSLPIQNSTATVYVEGIAYSRALNAWGQSGILNLLLPYAQVSARGDVFGQPRSRSVSGPGDPVLRVAMNLYGAPALAPMEFAAYQQQTIVGLGLVVTAPLGQYDPSKLINIGTNRWSFKPEMGVSVASGKHWTFESVGSATVYTDNDDFLNGRTRSQKPLYALQGHLIYNVGPGFWFAADGTYYVGGRTAVNGKVDNDLQQNTRWGVTMSKAVDRHDSVKLNYSNGLTARAGTNFNTISVVWQYAWFDD
jgi:outer membrane putative beta-barrel porin/alpha-amylase